MNASSAPQPDAHARIRVRDTPEDFRDASEQLLKTLEQLRYPEAARFAVRIAFEEAVVNAIRHGGKTVNEPVADVEWNINEQRVEISVADPGPGFDPQDVPDPTDPERIELPSGRGIMLMRAYMTTVNYNEAGNRVEMVYERPDDEPASPPAG